MKKLIILFLIFIGSFALFLRVHAGDTTQPIASIVQSTGRKTTPSPTPIPVADPATISIPAIGVKTNVQSVGMDAQGRMGVPTNEVDTAWYKYGFRPGENGSAVIDGHYDTPTGAPAVFYNLDQLQVGDTITVTDATGRSYTFQITQVVNYPYNALPMKQIFDSTDKPRLNLITCSGTWDRTSHNYLTRAVIYSVLINSKI